MYVLLWHVQYMYMYFVQCTFKVYYFRMLVEGSYCNVGFGNIYSCCTYKVDFESFYISLTVCMNRYAVQIHKYATQHLSAIVEVFCVYLRAITMNYKYFFKDITPWSTACALRSTHEQTSNIYMREYECLGSV